MKKFILMLCVTAVFSLLQGCAGGLLVAAGTAVAVGSDERSIEQQYDDNKLTIAALKKIKELNISDENLRIDMISNSGYLLVIGQVSDQEKRDQIEKELIALGRSKGIYNQLRIRNPIGIAQQSKDSWITAKIKTLFTTNKTVNPLKIKVVTEDSEVFLIGKVEKEMADTATNVARKVGGVKQVNRVFQFIEQ